MKTITAILSAMGLSLLITLGGCKSPQQFKDESDKQVYNIIDKKWTDDIGSKANYKISDTDPLKNDLQIKEIEFPGGVCNLAQAVKIATACNRQYQNERENLYLTALDLTTVRHEYAPNLLGIIFGGYSKAGPDKATGIQGGLGVQQLLATGAQVTGRLAANWINVISGNMDNGLAGLFSASITQPLLRGAGRKVVLEKLTQAERDTLYQIRLFNRFRKTFAVSIAEQYYRVLEKYDIYQNTKQNFNTLIWVYDRSIKLAQAGRIPQHELEQTRQDKMRAEDDLLQAKSEYEEALDKFKLFLSVSPRRDFVLDYHEFDALKKTVRTDIQIDLKEVLTTARQQRLDLANAADAVLDAQRKVEVAADGLRAELNLIASANSVTDDNKGNFLTLDKLEEKYGIGAAVDLPLDRLEERNIYRQSLIALSRSKRTYEEAADKVDLAIRQDYRDLLEAAKRYQVQRNSVELAQTRFDNTFKLLPYRRANTRDVLDAQRDLLRAQNAAATTLVDYTIATLKFYQDSGILKVRPDGMWEYKLIASR